MMTAVRISIGLFLFQLLTFAGPIPTCTTQTFATYESYGSAGCSIGSDYIASNFSFTANVQAAVGGFVNNINDTNLMVTPTLGANGPDLLFTGGFGVGGGTLAASTYTGVLKFTLTSANTPFAALLSNTLTLNGTRNGLLSVADVDEVNCLGGLLGPGLACLGGGLTVNNSAALAVAGSTAQAALSLNSTHLVDVVKTIHLTGAIGGSASLSSIDQNFASVGTPEPATFGIVALALFGLGAARKRSARRS